MSQEEVLDLLKKEKREMAVGEITLLLAGDIYKIAKDLNKMLKYNEIQAREIDRHEARKLYPTCKRRIRLYSVKKK